MVDNSIDRFNGVLASLAVKAPCVAVSIVNITLSGEQTVNSVAVLSGDRVLVTSQADDKDNGIYVASSAAWARAADFDGNRDAANGTLVVVATTPLVGFYQMTATNPVVIGTTDLTFTLVADMDIAGNLALTTAGQGASLVGVEDSGGNYVGTTVEAVLAELVSAATGEGASLIKIEDAAGLFVATEVEGALAEIGLSKNYYVAKAADTARNMVTTMANDPDLVIALPVAGEYLIEAQIVFSGDTIGTQGIKVNINFDGGVGGGRLVRTGFVNSAELTLAFAAVRATETLVDFTGATIDAGVDGNLLYYQGLLVATGVGDVAVSWAQNSSNADDVFVHGGSTARSYLKATRVA